jgi:very-long-chain (3R)-3-hydroxyacyl-CoA dehydratase
MYSALYGAFSSGLPLTSPASLSLVWERVNLPLKYSQTVALMEIVHAALGIVRSPVLITATQVASRLWILWGIVVLAPESTTTTTVSLAVPNMEFVGIKLSLITLLTAWCLSEIIRYGFFACKEANIQSQMLVWLRYSGFLVLYPLGVASELSMVWLALPVIQVKKPFSIELPNPFNFAFSYHALCVLIVAAYLPGFPQLYGYMLKQRKKVLGPGTRHVPPSMKKDQ